MKLRSVLFLASGAGLIAVAISQRQLIANTLGADYDAATDIFGEAGTYVTGIVNRVISSVTRGFRNNNPLNIRVGQDWQGEIDPSQKTDSAFEQYVAPEYGFRAACRVLDNYRKIHGLNTVAGIVGRWAPTTENPTPAYVNYVCEYMSVGPNQILDTADSFVMMRLIDGMARFENSGLNPYSQDVMLTGISMARGGVNYA